MALLAITATALFLTFLSVNGHTKSYYDGDVEILSSTGEEFVFRYSAPVPQLVTVEGYPEEYGYPQIPNTTQNRIEGRPLLPVKVVPIGLPFGVTPSISIISQRYQPLGQVKVPIFLVASSAEEFQQRVGAQKEFSGQWPQQTAWIAGEEVIRGLRITKVAVAAAMLSGNQLFRADEVVVKVTWHGSPSRSFGVPRPIGPVFERILPRLVANYDQALPWRVPWPFVPGATQVTSSPFDSAANWIKVEVTSGGVYRLTRFDLTNAGWDVEQIDPRRLRMFYGGGAELPFDNDQPRPTLVEIPIRVVGEDDGTFDYADQILFYGEPVDRFEFDATSDRYVYRRHHYTARNVFWLTYDGDFGLPPKRWRILDGAPSGTPFAILTSFDDADHQEQEYVFYRTQSTGEYVNYFEWYWGRQTSFTVNMVLTDPVIGTPARIVVKSRTPFERLTVNGIQAELDSVYRSAYYHLLFFRSTNLRSGYNTLVLSNSTEFFLDFVEIHYQHHLAVADLNLAFGSPSTPGLMEYRVAHPPTGYLLLEVTALDSVAEITGGVLGGDTLRFQHFNTGRRRFFITAPSRFRPPSKITPYQPLSLRDPTHQADYLIVAPPIFLDAAQRLAQHRQQVNPQLRTFVVSVEDIYNQFSWGLFDPLAIRDFLKYTFENWSGAQPSYVLLLGDGHYDYRNNLGTARPNLIPPFEAVDPPEAGSSASDENFIYFGEFGYFDSDSSGSLDMIVGRLCVNSVSELDAVLDKIVQYESQPEMGRWRNTIVVAADDNLGGPNSYYETFHTRQAETLANQHVPATMEVEKIYLVEYPFRTGSAKGDAREDLVATINRGALVVDWIGHGSRAVWAHEQLFRRVEDIPRLRNAQRLALFLAASCSIGFFDSPSEQGMAEDLVNLVGGGAIAAIGATRYVFAGPNTDLNNEIFDQLLFGDTAVSFGEAFFVAKFLRQLASPYGPIANDRNYMLFGDPALVAGKPTLNAEFSYRPDSLRGLTVDSVAGGIYDGLGQLQSDFNGRVWVLVRDAAIQRHKAITDQNNMPLNPPNYIYVDYVLPGRTVFSGPAEVRNGLFSVRFFVPKDVTYGGTGAKIYVYFENGQFDGSGVIDSLAVAASSSGELDTIGPAIEVFYDGLPLGRGITAIPSGATLVASLRDEHGINMTGTMGHGITIALDEGKTYQTDITERFSFELGSWQQGSVSFQLPLLPEGEYRFSMKAWDNYNNSSLYQVPLKLFSDEAMALREVMNYPNPVIQAESTVFQYLLTRPAEMVTIKIFTLAGRRIKTFSLTEDTYTREGYNFVPWGLRDDDGDRLASGVYIYQVEATAKDALGKKRRASYQSKVVVLR